MPPFNENTLTRSYQDEVDSIVAQMLSISPGVGYFSMFDELIMNSEESLTRRYGEAECDKIINDARKTFLERSKKEDIPNRNENTNLFPHIRPRPPNAPKLGTEIAADQGEDK